MHFDCGRRILRVAHGRDARATLKLNINARWPVLRNAPDFDSLLFVPQIIIQIITGVD